MEKTKNKFLYGALILTITGIIAKVIGAFYRVPLVNMIGSKGLGIFQLIFPIYSFFLVLVSGGMALGMSKVISIEVKNNGGVNTKRLLKSACIMMLVLSSICGVILFGISFPLSVFQGDKSLCVCYFALIPALIFSSLISVFRGYFQGLENMLPSGISMIIEQVVKLLTGLFFAKIFIKTSIIKAVFGAFIGITLSELVTLLYLILRYFFIKFNKKTAKITQNNEKIEKNILKAEKYSDKNKDIQISNKVKKLTTKDSFSLLIKTTVPIMLNSIIMPLVGAIESSLAIWLLSKATISTPVATSLFGLEDGVVGSLVNLPIVISSSLSTAILPSVASSFNSNDKSGCEAKSKNALKISWLIALPCVFAFLILSPDLVKFLYSNGLGNSAFDELKVVVDLVRLSSLSILYISLLNIVTSILQAINKSFVPVKNLILSSIVKIIFTIVLVSNKTFNIYGLVISDIIGYSLALVLDLRYLKSMLNIKFDLLNFAIKPLISVAVMSVSILVTKKVLVGLVTNRMLTLSTCIFGAVVYLTMIFITKVINKNDLPFMKKFQKNSKN